MQKTKQYDELSESREQNDDDFQYDQKIKQKAENVDNQHYDEAIEMSEEGSDIQSQESQNQPQIQPQQQQQQNNQPIQGEYNPQDYANLNVSQDIQQLFQHIQSFKPNFIEIEATLKVFIPDYVPAVGEVDACLKMGKPNSEQEQLGLTIIDEPCLNQSKKAKLDLMMNELMKKQKKGKQQTIHSIENAEKNPKEIMGWIKDVQEIQKTKTAPSVDYSKKMPDIDTLMQVWPQEIEELLYSTKFPSEEIDISLLNYCELACNFLDIPVHQTSNNKNIIESLHVLFTLYSEFKQNQHFQKQDEQQEQITNY